MMAALPTYLKKPTKKHPVSLGSESKEEDSSHSYEHTKEEASGSLYS